MNRPNYKDLAPKDVFAIQAIYFKLIKEISSNKTAKPNTCHDSRLKIDKYIITLYSLRTNISTTGKRRSDLLTNIKQLLFINNTKIIINF